MFEESWNMARKVKNLGTLIAAQQLSPSLTHSTQDFVRLRQRSLVLVYLLFSSQWTDVICNVSLILVPWAAWRLWRAMGFVVGALKRSWDFVPLTLGTDLGLVTCAVREAGSLVGLYLKSTNREKKTALMLWTCNSWIQLMYYSNSSVQ